MKVHITNESAFDYIKKIKSNSVDLVLIDPPYEISQESGFLNGKETGTDTDRFRRSLDFGE
jgi:DNA modification methylase